MNKIFKIATIALAGAAVFASCQREPEMPKYTDVGPEMTVISQTEATYMGADVKFSVDLKDKEFALSTLKAALYYDDTKVSDLYLRTKEYGTYDCVLHAPLYKEIPDGIASIVLTAQNVGMGLTYDTLYVSLQRPNFETVYLVDESDNKIEMTKTGDYTYAYEGDFPTLFKAKVVTPAINDEGEVVTLGFDGTYMSSTKDAFIPFSTGIAGHFTLTVDLYTLKAAPVGSGNVVAVAEFEQGQTMDFGGVVDFNNWVLDYDYFVVNEDFTAATFRPVSGLYRMEYNIDDMFIKVEPMADQDNVLTLSADGTGAPWVIGSGVGKPVVGPSWNTEDGAYPMAQISDKVYQFTLTCPGQLSTTADFKIFHQKGWGGEFLTSDYAEINLAPAFEMDPSSGNIKSKDTTPGKSYKLILDLTGGVKAAKISYEEVEIASNTLDIKVNGVGALKVSNTIYKVAAVKVDQNSTISFSGIENPEQWWVDPDHFAITAEGLQFKAVTGFYSFELNLEEQFVTVRRVKEDGKAATYVDEGAITFMGWGVGHPYIASPLAWDGGHLITLAEIEDGVYQFTGVAGEGTDTTMGVRWQYDSELSFKFFGQAGWGVEWGKVTLTDEAKKWLEVYGNVELIGKDPGAEEGKWETRYPLELGATYVMTVTDCTEANADGKFDCTIDFRKL